MHKYPYLWLTLSSTPKCYFFAGRPFSLEKWKSKWPTVRNMCFQTEFAFVLVWSKNTVMEPVDSVTVYGDGCYKGLGNFNTKTTTHGKLTRNRALQKVSWNSLKIHSFDFGNGMYGNVTSLEHKEIIKWKLWPIFEWFWRWKNTGLVVNIQSLMPYSISIRVRN